MVTLSPAVDRHRSRGSFVALLLSLFHGGFFSGRRSSPRRWPGGRLDRAHLPLGWSSPHRHSYDDRAFLPLASSRAVNSLLIRFDSVHLSRCISWTGHRVVRQVWWPLIGYDESSGDWFHCESSETHESHVYLGAWSLCDHDVDHNDRPRASFDPLAARPVGRVGSSFMTRLFIDLQLSE